MCLRGGVCVYGVELVGKGRGLKAEVGSVCRGKEHVFKGWDLRVEGEA